MPFDGEFAFSPAASTGCMNLSRSLLEESSSHLKDALHGRWMDNMARRESGGFYRSPARRESGGFRAESTPSPRPRAASDSTPSALHLGPSQPRKAACSLRRESSDCTGAAAARRPRQVSHARCARVRTGGLDLGDAHEDGDSPKARKGGAGEYDGDTFDGDTFDAAAVPMARSLGTMPGLHFPRERSAGGSQARRHRSVETQRKQREKRNENGNARLFNTRAHSYAHLLRAKANPARRAPQRRCARDVRSELVLHEGVGQHLDQRHDLGRQRRRDIAAVDSAAEIPLALPLAPLRFAGGPRRSTMRGSFGS